MIRPRPALFSTCVALLFAALSSPAQDMPTRVEAIRLLNRANQLSTVSGTPYFRTDVTFHAYSVSGTRTEGTMHRIFTPDGQWIETIYPPIHSIAVFTPKHVLQNAYVPPPPEIGEAFSLLPIRLISFDESDVIQSISDAQLLDRPAKCIRFETVNGKTAELNEICVDAERGTLLRSQIGKVTNEYSDFFPIGAVWLPHQIRQHIDGRLRMEEQQTGALLDSPIDVDTLAPPNPTIIHRCKQFRHAAGQAMPQPDDAGAGPWLDVRVHIVVWQDGRVHEATTLPQGHAELEAEAVRIARTWQYDPATCDGRPTIDSADVAVHFPPR